LKNVNDIFDFEIKTARPVPGGNQAFLCTVTPKVPGLGQGVEGPAESSKKKAKDSAARLMFDRVISDPFLKV
jgi:hypothetical protein